MLEASSTAVDSENADLQPGIAPFAGTLLRREGRFDAGDALTLEQQRLAALHSLHILDTVREPEFDHIVELAAAICGTPISSCTLIDEHRQWFKASVGIGTRETSRELSFCAHAIRGANLMEVEDATRDRRFHDHPWVTGEAGIRFYAGMPLPDPNGYMLGTLCVADTVPRVLTEVQKSALRVLTDQLKVRIELAAEHQRLERVLAEKEALLTAFEASEQRFRAFMNNGPFLAYIRDRDSRFSFYSRQVAERFQVSTTEWLGKTLDELFPDAAADYRASDNAALTTQAPVEAIEQTRDEAGNVTFWRSFKFGFRDVDGHPLIGGISVDITDEVKTREELEYKTLLLERFATTDALTGLANRRAIDQELRTAVRKAVDGGQPLSVVLLDIDNFKWRNDTYGHHAGDEVLRRLGTLLASQVRASDLAGRYGGEEMVLLLRGAAQGDAVAVAEQIRKEMAKEEWPDAPVTASFGVSSLTPACRTPHALLAEADRAMYYAKRDGKDRVVASAGQGNETEATAA